MKYKFWAVFALFCSQAYADDQSILKYTAEGNEEKVIELLDQGVHPDTMDREGFSLPLIAARQGHIRIFSILKERGADIYAETNDGLNALHLASAADQPEMTDHLLQLGFDPSKPDGARNMPPLQWALEKEFLLTALVLLRGGADINQVDEYGWTALHHAGFLWKLAGVKFLEDRSADVSAENNAGETPEELSRLSRRFYDYEYKEAAQKDAPEQKASETPEPEENQQGVSDKPPVS